MSDPPHHLGVDPDDNEDMADSEDDHDQDEAGAAERHAPAHGALVPPFARHGRPETRYRMELGRQIYALIVDASIRPAHYRDIQADDRLLWMWRGMSRDMYGLMRHVVGATTAVMRLRRNVRSYRRSQAAAGDGQSASSDSHASHDRSPRDMVDENEAPLAASSSHHGDEAGPSATSSQQPATSISTHDHEQAGPSTVEAAPLTEQASTSTNIDIVVPPVYP